MTERTVRLRFTGQPSQFIAGYPPLDGDYPAEDAARLIASGIYAAANPAPGEPATSPNQGNDPVPALAVKRGKAAADTPVETGQEGS